MHFSVMIRYNLAVAATKINNNLSSTVILIYNSHEKDTTNNKQVRFYKS